MKQKKTEEENLKLRILYKRPKNNNINIYIK